jgi:hypothetical protein
VSYESPSGGDAGGRALPSGAHPHAQGLRSPDADRLSEQSTIRPEEEHVGNTIRP